jgi:hypothetical protein
MRHDLGYSLQTRAELDWNPPDWLEKTLGEKTGVPFSVVRSLSAKGWIPHIFDSLDGDGNCFDQYTAQYSVLMAPEYKSGRNIPGWLPWHSESLFAISAHCPLCNDAPFNANPSPLFRRFPIILTCPRHKVMLKPFNPPLKIRQKRSGSGTFTDEGLFRAPLPLLYTDQLTLAALRNGYVVLPNMRRLTLATWVRVLRAIVEEVCYPLNWHPPRERELIADCWALCGLKGREKTYDNMPFENMNTHRQRRKMMAASSTILLMLKRIIEPRGPDAQIFLP